MTTGIFGIARKFKIVDDDGSGQIDLSEFSKCVAEHAHDWNSKQIKMLFDFFDKDKSGSISYNEFLLGVREKMNDRRIQFVLQAFEVCK
jgi:Ca2+-binding EF-hand superfamily protein